MLLTKRLKRPKVFYGWWIVASSSLVAGIGSVNTLGFTVFFLPLSHELGLSRAVTSLVQSVSRLEGGLLGPGVGALIDRVGPRRVLVFGSVMGGLGFILMGLFARNLWSLLLIYMLVIGVGFNTGFFPGAMAAVNAWFVRRRTLAMSTVNAAWGGAGFILVPLLSFVILHWGWRTAAVVAGCLVMATAVPAALFVRRSPESMGLRPDGDGVVAPDAPLASATAARAVVSQAPLDGFTVREALRTPTLWLMIAAQTLRAVSYTSVLVHFAPILVWKGMSQQGAANLIGLWSLLVIPASLTIGILGDRLSKKLVLSALIFGAACMYFFLGVSSHRAALWAFVLMLAPFDNLGVLNWSLVGEYFGRRSFATLRGIMAGVGSVVTAASPVYTGWVYDRTQSYEQALVPFAGALLAASVIYALLPRPKAPSRAA